MKKSLLILAIAAGLWIFCVVDVGEAVTILFEDFEDSSGFTVGGASAGYWGIAPLTGTASIPSGFIQGGSQDGNIFYGSFAKDYFDGSYDPSLQSLMTINIPDLTAYTNLELTVTLAAPVRIWEPTHRDSLHIINGTVGGDCSLPGCPVGSGVLDSFLPSSYPDSLGSNVHSVDLGLQFQDFAYTIDSSLESLTFAFASTDYPEVIGIDSVMITGDPACTDADGDGYYPETGCLEPLDCNDANKNIYPTNPNIYCDCEGEIQQGVTENCTGGVDEDCDGLVDDADPECQGYSAAANAEASTYGSNSLTGSGVLNGLTLLLIPAGAVLLLRIRRRKTQ